MSDLDTLIKQADKEEKGLKWIKQIVLCYFLGSCDYREETKQITPFMGKGRVIFKVCKRCGDTPMLGKRFV